jgi:hypothetical protein
MRRIGFQRNYKWMVGSMKLGLKDCYELCNINQNLHKIVNRVTPEMFCIYKLSLLLHKLYNDKFPIEEWTHLNLEQILTTRQTHFKITHNHNLMVGKMQSLIGCTL